MASHVSQFPEQQPPPSPHEPLQDSRLVVPGEGSVEEEVEDRRVDGHQEPRLQAQLQRRAGLHLQPQQ